MGWGGAVLALFGVAAGTAEAAPTDDATTEVTLAAPKKVKPAERAAVERVEPREEHEAPEHVRPRLAAGTAAPETASLSSRARASLPRTAKDAAGLGVSVRTLRAEELGKQPISVAEVSLAFGEAFVLATGNEFASAAASPIGPLAPFPYENLFLDKKGEVLRGDQVVDLDGRGDLCAWVGLIGDGVDEGFLRLAVSSAVDRAAGEWHRYEIRPFDVGRGPDEWLDYPDLVFTDSHLVLAFNAYKKSPCPEFRTAIALRLPLASLRAHGAAKGHLWLPPDKNGIELARGASKRVVMAWFECGSLGVGSWADGETVVHRRTVAVSPVWNGPAKAAGPDGYDWLKRDAGDITAGWEAGGAAGFAWTMAARAEDGRPRSFVHVVLVDPDSGLALLEHDLWHDEIAYGYPTAGVDADGAVAFTFFYSGKKQHLSHGAGVILPPAAPGGDWSWDLVEVVAGKAGPKDEEWGDYAAVRKDPRAGAETSWVATGWTQQRGAGPDGVVVHLATLTGAPGNGGARWAQAMRVLRIRALERRRDEAKADLDDVEARLRRLR